jgi:hypothetical protein
LGAGDPLEVANQAEYVFPSLFTHGDDQTLLQRFQLIRHDIPFTMFGPRALNALARACDRLDMPEMAIAAAQLLLTHHARNPITPGCVWQMVSCQERAGRPDLVKKTLCGLLEYYPADPITARARDKLQRDFLLKA